MRSSSKSAANKPEGKSHRIFLKSNIDYNCNQTYEEEKILNQVKFNKIVFSPACDKPVVFLSCLVEFGCESLLPHFFMPSFFSGYQNHRRIAIGWPGRSLFYRSFFDEYWEIDPKCTNLRAYTKAFNGMSKNIKNIENALKNYGNVFGSAHLNNFFCEGACVDCKKRFLSMLKVPKCPKCQSEKIINSVIADTNLHKHRYVPIPFNFEHMQDWLGNVVKTDRAVGIFARNRKTYGRNLPKEFYKAFCKKLEKHNYEILWLGEKASTLKCISGKYFDFTKSEYADDIERCFALVSRCKATFQAWTASTRFSQALNVPYCLVESFDQLFGNGQEGKRINLLTRELSNKKIILSNYSNVIRDHRYFADFCVEHFLNFLENNNSDDVVGMVERPESLDKIIKASDLWKTL